MHTSTSLSINTLTTSPLSIKVVKAPDAKLRVKTKPVKKITPVLVKTLKEMVKLTKTFTDPEGVGLASTQIGLDGKFFVAKDTPQKKEHFIIVINPQILSTGKRVKTYFEGCLSIPNYFGNVKRYTNIKVKYQDENGRVITKALKGVPSWIFQHEMDHLNGVLFPDKVLQQKGRFFKLTGKDATTKEDIFEEITL